MSPDRILILGGGKKMLQGARNVGLEVLSIQKRSQFKELPLCTYSGSNRPTPTS